MKGNYIYIFLLGFQCALGIVYMGHKFFSGGTSFVDNDNEHTALSSSSLSEEDAVWTVLAAKAVDVNNISGSTTTVKNKSDNDKNKETFKKKEEKSLRSDGDANTHHGSTKTDKKKTDKKETDKKEDVKKTKKKSLRSDTNEANDKSSISVDIESLGK